MTRRVATVVAAVLALAAGAAATARAQPLVQSTDDTMTDAAMKRAEVIAFIGLKPGDRVVDVVAGRFIRALSVAVGPTGKVYALQPAEVIRAHPEVLPLVKGLASQPGYENVEVTTPPIGAPALPSGVDAVFIRQNYHDLHDAFMGPADVPAFNRAVFAALKPGGVYVVLDHAAASGSGLRDTDTLHRIDPAAVKAEVLAAGFVFDGRSAILANPADDHSRMVFDPAIRGRTDQFLYRFRKPR